MNTPAPAHPGRTVSIPAGLVPFGSVALIGGFLALCAWIIVDKITRNDGRTLDPTLAWVGVAAMVVGALVLAALALFVWTQSRTAHEPQT